MLCCGRQALISKAFDAHLFVNARRKAVAASIVRPTAMQAYFDTQASHIQRCFRSFWSRKYIHNFVQRKAYLAAVAKSSAQMRVLAEQEQQASLR